ncbi:Hypothetical protein NocV09_02300740 [Nannochloropsis oceanica]
MTYDLARLAPPESLARPRKEVASLVATGLRFINGVSSSYDTTFPPALAGVMSETDFVEAVGRVNNVLVMYWPCTMCFVCGNTGANRSGDKARVPAELHATITMPSTEIGVAGGLEKRRQDEERRGQLLILPTIQRSRVDTVRFGVDVEEEKDRCLEYFADFARPLCESLRSQGHWADFIDPCSGLPMMTPHCTRPYNEVAGFEHLLRYTTQNAGCCKILLHPRWGSSCYPATIFTTAPLENVQAAIKVAEKGEAWREGGIGMRRVMEPAGVLVD